MTPDAQQICRIIRWLASRYCADMIWNRDISREVDKLIAENDRLRSLLDDRDG